MSFRVLGGSDDFRRIVLETKLSGRAGLTQQPFEA